MMNSESMIAKEDYEAMDRIAERVSQIKGKHGFEPFPKNYNTVMYLEAAHKVCTIDFEMLKNASDSDLVHDVAGIIANLNLETGKIENDFVLQCAKLEEPFFEHVENDKFIHGDYYFDAKARKVGILLEDWNRHGVTSPYIGSAETPEMAQRVIEAFEEDTEFKYDKTQIDEIIESKNVLSIDIESKDARYASLELGNNVPQTLDLQPEL